MLCQELLQASSLSVFQDITRFSGKGWPLYTIPLTGVGSYVYVILPEHGIRRSRKPHDPAALKPKQLGSCLGSQIRFKGIRFLGV